MESDTGCGTSARMLATLGSFMENPACRGVSSSVPGGLPSLRAELAHNQEGLSESGNLVNHINYDFRGLPTLYPHSLPEYIDGFASGAPCNSDRNMPATVSSQERVENTHFGRTSSSVEMCNGMNLRSFNFCCVIVQSN